MNIILPISYINTLTVNDKDTPIPLLDVNGRLLIERAFEQYADIPNAKFYAILKNDAWGHEIEKRLPSYVHCIYIQNHTRGAPCSCLYAIDELNHDSELLVTSLDQIVHMDMKDMLHTYREQNCDGGSVIFHTDDEKYSFAQIENGIIVRTAEKKSICSTGMVGLYYFKTTKLFLDYTKELLRKQVTQYNNGYFLSGVLNEMILDNCLIVPYSPKTLVYNKVYDIDSYNNLLTLHNGVPIDSGDKGIDIHHLQDFVRGWVVGDFNPTLYATQDCEFAVQNFKKGDLEAPHYHKVATEITVIVSGKAKMQNKIVYAGDVVVVNPYEKTGFEALEDTMTAVLKIPGALNDKYMD